VTRNILLLVVTLLCSCASFDRTNILPGQQVVGLGFSFSVPTEKAWFAAEYGTSHRIKLNQLNDDERYAILVSLNRGPVSGMFQDAETHLRVLQYHKQTEVSPAGFFPLSHDEWVDSQYGRLCVRYTSLSEDWRGRNHKGGATMVSLIGLSCEHPEIPNVLITFEISRRYEVDALPRDLAAYADKLFSSIEYQSVE